MEEEEEEEEFQTDEALAQKKRNALSSNLLNLLGPMQLYVELGDYQRAAESNGEIVQLCPENVEALKTGAKVPLVFWRTILKVIHLNSKADSGIVDLLASVFMETNAYDKALQHIEHSHLVYYSGEELPLNLKIRAGICHIHLGNMEK
ncbi:hypothetical protein QYF36_008507 [Acer negundo]|nr:hypothetical protein QYF36_008507 [Acer negundo]